jgi:hypothetical protein
VVPDGREDISLAAMFEIGRLLTLSKPTLVASLMQWRRELFGAARARELTDLLIGELFAGFAIGVAGGRNALEDLIRTHVVGTFTGLPAGTLAPNAAEVTRSRVPSELVDLAADAVLTGLGADPRVVRRATKQFGADGLAAVPFIVSEATTVPVSKDKVAMTGLQSQLAQRVDQLTANALKLDLGNPHGGKRGRKKDTLDRLISEATDATKRRRED